MHACNIFANLNPAPPLRTLSAARRFIVRCAGGDAPSSLSKMLRSLILSLSDSDSPSLRISSRVSGGATFSSVIVSLSASAPPPERAATMAWTQVSSLS